jgi:hypothetical protein
MDTGVTGSVVPGRTNAASNVRLAFASITAGKQQSARASTRRTPLTVRVGRLNISQTLTTVG